MPQENGLSYESVCSLVGRIILDNHARMEELGRSLANMQEQLNTALQENQQLKRRLASYDASGTGLNNPSNNSGMSEVQIGQQHSRH